MRPPFAPARESSALAECFGVGLVILAKTASVCHDPQAVDATDAAIYDAVVSALETSLGKDAGGIYHPRYWGTASAANCSASRYVCNGTELPAGKTTSVLAPLSGEFAT
jgi:hypothetical protein